MRPMPVLWRITASTVALVMALRLVMGMGIIVLLLERRRWAHVGVGLRGLLTGHVIRIDSSSLLVVVGVCGRIVEGVDGLIVIRGVDSLKHGPGHVCLAVLWMWGIP